MLIPKFHKLFPANTMSVVLVTDRITDLDLERDAIPGFEVCIPEDDFCNSDVLALLVWHEEISSSYISKYENLRFIGRYGVGFDNIDLNFANSSGITCVNTPDYGVDEVAQTALSFILGISRGTFWYSQNPLKDTLWTNPSPLPITLLILYSRYYWCWSHWQQARFMSSCS